LVNSVVRHGSQLVAVGSKRSAGEGRSVIWTSQNGRRWREAFAEPKASVTAYTSVASDGRWIVAVGYRGRFEATTPGIMAISRDGKAWRAVRREGQFFVRQGAFSAVAAYERGFVALGVDDPSRGTATVYVTSKRPR
jgi:hypothetical protein